MSLNPQIVRCQKISMSSPLLFYANIPRLAFDEAIENEMWEHSCFQEGSLYWLSFAHLVMTVAQLFLGRMLCLWGRVKSSIKCCAWGERNTKWWMASTDTEYSYLHKNWTQFLITHYSYYSHSSQDTRLKGCVIWILDVPW